MKLIVIFTYWRTHESEKLTLTVLSGEIKPIRQIKSVNERA